MRRDMELVRRILIATEEQAGQPGVSRLEIPGYEPGLIRYNAKLLESAGYMKLLKAMDETAIPLELTWAGHDFLDSIRSETIWGKVKGQVGNALNTVSLEVVKDLAVRIAQSQLERD